MPGQHLLQSAGKTGSLQVQAHEKEEDLLRGGAGLERASRRIPLIVFLTEANVLHYLVRRGFARYDAVTSGDYAVRNLTRRNRNFRVSAGAQEFLVKQA